MIYAWLVPAALLLPLHLFLAISESVRRWAFRTRKPSVRISAAVFLAALCLGAPLAALFAAGPNQVALLLLAAPGFIFGLAAYLIRQRLAPAPYRMGLARIAPMLLPITTLLSLSAGIAALSMLSAWPASIAFVVAWYLTGITCTEIVIRFLMRETGIDRKAAILNINASQRRRSSAGPSTRYPFH